MKILIVEDEKDLRELLTWTLEKEGHTVYSAMDGGEGLDLFRKTGFDLALFDVNMPVMDGLTLLKLVRESSDSPVIMLTARGEETDKLRAFGLGADDYLVKPFSMAELLARITVHQRRSQILQKDQRASILEAGNLLLNIQEWSLRKGQEEIILNPKEFLILKCFMENPGRVFTKKQLYAAAWESDYLYDGNTIMVHISRLRNKIEDDPQNPAHIRTIKGIGYKFSKEAVE